ncbi:hypothetical protein ACFE04_006281 [Oxalis oulophora]
MKGFIKGFKYFTQMFEEKEPKFTIGLPTDVKHVAHIGFDGPSANTPSWMKDFDAAPELTSNVNPGDMKNLSTQEKSLPPFPKSKPNNKTRRKNLPESGSPCSSPTGKKSDTPKQSRRNRSANNSMDEGSSGRRNRQQKSSTTGSESPSNNPAARKSRPRKIKESSNDVVSRSSAKKNAAEPRNGGKSKDGHVNSVLESGEENKECNGNPREYRARRKSRKFHAATIAATINSTIDSDDHHPDCSLQTGLE